MTLTQHQILRSYLLADILTFTRYFFKVRFKRKFVVGEHHLLVAEALNKVLSGETKRLIINIAPRYGKCVSTETLIMTESGLIRADEIKPGVLVYSHKDGNIVLRKCLGTETAQKESVTITMKSGREITCSYDHPMLTTFGYKQAKDIKPKERIKAINTEIDGEYFLDNDELIFVALMIFEGNCNKKNIRFSNTDDQILNLFFDVCKRLEIDVKQYESSAPCDWVIMGGVNGIAAKILKRHGIYGHLSYTKRIPKTWFALNQKQKRLFIDIMFATDGYVHQKNGTAGICLANKGLIEDIQHLLATMGIIGHVCYAPNKCAGGWKLTVPRMYAQRLIDKISFYHKRENALKCLLKKSNSSIDTYPYEIIPKERLTYKTLHSPHRCATHKDITREKFNRLCLTFPQLEKYKDNDFYLDEVVRIENIGVKDLIHLEIEETHNFIANGLVSHNTEVAVKNFIAAGLALNSRAKFIHLSYSDDLVRDNSSEVQTIMRTPEYQSIFRAYPTSTNSKKWYTQDGGALYAVSSSGQVTGFGAGLVENEEEVKASAELEGELADLESTISDSDVFGGAIVIDDPIKPDDALSPLIRNKVNNKFESTIRSRVNSRNTPIVIIMQRVHEEDLCGYLLKQEPDDWEVLRLPCIYTDESGEEKALWPFKHNLEELKSLREKNAFVFDTQYQQDPQPLVGLMYEQGFREYEVIPATGKRLRKNYTDTADEGKDFLCSICYIETEIGNFVTDVLYTQKAMEYTEPKTAEMLTKHDIQIAVIESNNGGRGFARAIERLMRLMKNNKTRVKWFHQALNKNVRIFSRSAEAQNLTYFPKGWDRLWPEFYRALTSYMKVGKNEFDDGPDALTGSIEWRDREQAQDVAGLF